METEDLVFLAGVTDGDEVLDDARCRRFFDLPRVAERLRVVPEPVAAQLAEAHQRRHASYSRSLRRATVAEFDQDMDQLDRWAQDRRSSLRAALDELDELDELDAALKAAKRTAALRRPCPRAPAGSAHARRPARRRVARVRPGERRSRPPEGEPLFTLRWRLE